MEQSSDQMQGSFPDCNTSTLTRSGKENREEQASLDKIVQQPSSVQVLWLTHPRFISSYIQLISQWYHKDWWCTGRAACTRQYRRVSSNLAFVEGWRLVPGDTFEDGELNNWAKESLVSKHTTPWALKKGHLHLLFLLGYVKIPHLFLLTQCFNML